MIKGIDVSHYQNEKGAIDWAKVKSAGYDFVYIKATEGLSMKDAFYARNIADARKAGLIVGSYHFARAYDAKEEADFFLSVVGKMSDYDFLVLDWEIDNASPDKWCRKFLDRCFEKTGVRPLFYTNEARVTSIAWDKVVEGNYGLIVAKYGDNDAILEDNEIAKTDEFPFAVAQQFSSNMTVPGITGRVDANIGNLSIEALKKYGKQPETTDNNDNNGIKIGDDLKSALKRCGASSEDISAIGDTFNSQSAEKIANIVNGAISSLEAKVLSASKVAKPTAAFSEAVKYAHDITIGETLTDEIQNSIAFRETELKKSEMASRGTIEKIKSILK